MSVQIFAPAKINLTLEVGRPRADGLHPLQSVVAFADVGDDVRAEPSDALSLEIIGSFASNLVGENLVLRAARALQTAAATQRGAALTLDKRLPIASGIGGGSSDAAAALKACNELWDLGWSEAQLAAVARSLGADVPVCVRAGAAYMTGAGDDYTPIELPRCCAVLVNPNMPLPTPDVYREFDRLDLGERFATATPPYWTEVESVVSGVKLIGNDLQRPAQNLRPIITEILQELATDGRARCVSLSGSGATVFALVANEADAEALATDFRARRPSWWCVSTTVA